MKTSSFHLDTNVSFFPLLFLSNIDDEFCKEFLQPEPHELQSPNLWTSYFLESLVETDEDESLLSN